MKNISLGKVERGRIWLPVSYAGNEIKFAYPSVRGPHQECYKAISKDKELVPAEGLDLTLLTFGAYNGKEPEWEDIRQNAFVYNYTRVPSRNLWLPAGTILVDKKIESDLAGVLIERDVKGLGLSTIMEVPDLKSWKQVDGIYVSPDRNQQFIPTSAYSDKFENDGYAKATLTQEGAELFAKTAKDAGKQPRTRKVDVNSITKPEQRVSLLGEDDDRLYLYGNSWGNAWDSHAFGVSKSGEASTPKN